MKSVQLRIIPALLMGALSISALSQSVYAQSIGNPSVGSQTGATQDAAIPKITLTNKTGTLWLGNAMNASIASFQGSDNVNWTLYARNSGGDGTGNQTFEYYQVDEQNLKSGLPYPVSTFATLPKTQYKLVARYMRGDLLVAMAEHVYFNVLEMPVITNTDMNKVLPAGNGTATSTVHFAIQSNDIAGRVLVSLGDKIEPVVATATSPGSNVYTASPIVPTSPGLYQLRVKVEQSLGVVSTPVTNAQAAVVTGPKIVIASAPKVLDPTGSGVPGKITVRAVNSVPEAVMPSTKIDPASNKRVSLYKAEWSSVPGIPPVVKSLEEPYQVSLSAQEYAALKDQATAAGLKSVTYPVTVRVFHPDYPQLITSTQTVNLKVAVPWSMPDWTVAPVKSATEVVAPATVTLQATPSLTYDRTAATTHKLKYTWSVPTQISARGSGDKITLQLNEAGTYPVHFQAVDDLGNVRDQSIEITAIPPTLAISDATFRMTPPNARTPVVVAPKVATTSTHTRERPNLYEIHVDGAVVQSGPALKPFTITGPGSHDVKIVAKSAFGSVAQKDLTLTVQENRIPTCQPLRSILNTVKATGVVTAVSLTAQCSDPDGRVKTYAWLVNGTPLTATTNRASYQFAPCESAAQVELKVTDDSSEVYTHTETIQRGGSDTCVAGG